MPNREKVIKGLEHCQPHAYSGMNCEECPYRKPSLSERKECDCVRELHNDVLDLLKWQEAVAPEKEHSGSGITWWNVCGNCKTAINPNDKYCHECGRAVKWNV